MKAAGIRTVLLTGDSRAAAEHIGTLVQVDEVIAEVLPEEKAGVVQRLQSQGRKVMMVGDGINDAPALTAADVGCAIGSGSDIAIESADLVLMKSDLIDVPRALRLSALTLRNIKQNLFWAFCYNTLGIPIAAGVLYLFGGPLLSPMYHAEVFIGLDTEFMVKAHLLIPEGEENLLYNWMLNFQYLSAEYVKMYRDSKSVGNGGEADIYLFSDPQWTGAAGQEDVCDPKCLCYFNTETNCAAILGMARLFAGAVT